MSKAKYKSKKEALKERKDAIKEEIENISTNSNLIPNLPPFFILLF